MEWLQSLLDGSTTPVLTALLLGLMTAISPCPLATNIAAVGYIAKSVSEPRKAFAEGLLYTLGRIVSYTVLGLILIGIIKAGSSAFGIQKFIAGWGGKILGPLLILVGLFMLFGSRLGLRGFGFGGDGKALAGKGGWGALLLGMLFALAFCPTSAVFYFGMLIPMSATVASGWALPTVFAVATALPVLAVAWILAFSAGSIGRFYGSVARIQKWVNIVVGVLFIAIGLYYTIIIFR